MFLILLNRKNKKATRKTDGFELKLLLFYLLRLIE
jgi:hypothetical protein